MPLHPLFGTTFGVSWPLPSFDGVPDSMEFVPEIPGNNEYRRDASTVEFWQKVPELHEPLGKNPD